MRRRLPHRAEAGEVSVQVRRAPLGERTPAPLDGRGHLALGDVAVEAADGKAEAFGDLLGVEEAVIGSDDHRRSPDVRQGGAQGWLVLAGLNPP